MQTWVAYQLDDGADAAWATRGLDRVERHYHPSADGASGHGSHRRHAAGTARRGMAMWDVAAPDCRWPSWQEHGGVHVATVLLPVGWQRVVPTGSRTPDAVALADALFQDPGGTLADLSPPFIVARFTDGEEPRLEFCNDGLGFATLYHLRFSDGDVWSNRLGALTLFSGTRAAAAQTAWSTFAGCGWFMGAEVPLEGATLVGPGTVVRLGGSQRWRAEASETGVVARWVSRHGALPWNEDAVIETVSEDLALLSGLFSEAPVLDLTAGLDSRLVAAVAVASGQDVGFRTGNPDWEVRTAKHLLSLAPRSYPHAVPTPSGASAQPAPAESGGRVRVRLSLAERAAALHHRHDGDWPPADITSLGAAGEAPVPRSVRITGGAGELAKGHFGKRHDVLRGAPASAIAEFLDAFFVAQAGGVTRDGRAQVRRHVEATVTLGLELGVRTDSLREFFYLMERTRRWGRANRHVNVANPLLNPSFIRAAFDLSSEQRSRAELHKGIIERLVPAWRDVPYNDQTFLATGDAGRSAGSAPSSSPSSAGGWDLEQLRELVEARETWEDSFEAPAVMQAWKDTAGGLKSARHRRLFHRLTWRATYEEHVRALNRGTDSGEPPVVVTTPRPMRTPLLLFGGNPREVAAVLSGLASSAPDIGVLDGASVHKQWLQPSSADLGEALERASSPDGKNELVSDGRRAARALLRTCHDLGVDAGEVAAVVRRHRAGSGTTDGFRANAALLAALFPLVLTRSGRRALALPIGRDVAKASRYEDVWPAARIVHLRSDQDLVAERSPARLGYSVDRAKAEPAVFAAWLYGVAGLAPAAVTPGQSQAPERRRPWASRRST